MLVGEAAIAFAIAIAIADVAAVVAAAVVVAAAAADDGVTHVQQTMAGVGDGGAVPMAVHMSLVN